MDQRPVRVLLVEDNALLARELTAAMEEIGNVQIVAVAVDEAQACKAMRQSSQAFDLLVVDVFLSAGSGLGVLRAARDAGLPLTIFMLTNFATLDVRRRCQLLGADAVFDKSRQLDEFLSEIAALAAPQEKLTAAELGADTKWP